ncbi:MAG: LPS biosynthesis flippase [Bacteroidales bacterium]|nr:LPS biosynthesis flippase [Bacteroidales bacterium]
MKLSSQIKDKINSGSLRSTVIKKNILGSFVIKGFSILTSLLLVPATLNLLNPEKYGIWITLYSIVTWFNMMDIGLGNGFRNKFAEAVALGDNERAKKLTETIYNSTGLIALSFFLFYLMIHPFLDWTRILNLPILFDEKIARIVLQVFALFTLQLVLKNITTILLALQKTATSNLIIFLGNLIALVSVLVLGKLNSANLQSISFVFMISPILVFILASIILFRGKLIVYAPSNFRIHREYFKSMLNLGLKFFLIQITTIVMFASGNFIITQLYGPEEVTPYNISYRLFAAALSIFTIITAPFWSAYTEAITKHDFSWIRMVLKKLNTTWIIFALCLAVILIMSPLIFQYWIGKSVKIPFALSASFALYASLLSWTGMFAQFLNGVGKIKIQLYIAIFQCITNIPLAILLAKSFNLGVTGVILAVNINLLFSAIILPVQVRKLSFQKASGLWNQ